MTGAVTTARAIGVPTKAEHAYVEMRARILDGRLAPGSVITSEAIAETLGLSGTPVREAMRRLAADDLVVLSAHRDARVKPLSRSELQGLYDVRRVLDAMAVEGACRNASDDALSAPAQLLATQAASTTPAEVLRANHAFHRSIYACCGNDVLIRLLDSLWDRTDRYRVLLQPSRRERQSAARQHREMAAAFAARDVVEMQRLLDEHSSGSFERLVEMLEA